MKWRIEKWKGKKVKNRERPEIDPDKFRVITRTIIKTTSTKSVCTLLMLTNVVKEERKSNEVEDRKMEREEKDVEGQVEAKNRGALKLTETNLG